MNLTIQYKNNKNNINKTLTFTKELQIKQNNCISIYIPTYIYYILYTTTASASENIYENEF
jgi:hypothetical protein